jgi:hypothetical protein
MTSIHKHLRTCLALSLFLLPMLSIGQPTESLLRKGSKVYVEPMDEASTAAAVTELDQWGYWKVTANKNEADFILRFHIDRTSRYCIGYAEFVDARTAEIIRTSKEANTNWSLGWTKDMKQILVKKIIRKRIIKEWPSPLS